jgi:hypothetical protein
MSEIQTMSGTIPNTVAKQPLPRRINGRLIGFVGTIVFLAGAILYMAWPAISMSYGGGIRHTSEGDEVNLKALGYFALDEHNGTIEQVPRKFRQLDGKKVILEGFMWGGDSVNRPHIFQFVWNIQNCCFNGPPLPQERVFVKVPEGRDIHWIDGFARIVGTLHVKVVKDHGSVVSVYTMDVDRAEPGS